VPQWPLETDSRAPIHWERAAHLRCGRAQLLAGSKPAGLLQSLPESELHKADKFLSFTWSCGLVGGPHEAPSLEVWQQAGRTS